MEGGGGLADGWFHDEFERYRDVLGEVSRGERVKVLHRVYARFAIRHPEYFRLLVLEGAVETGRTAWLVDEHLRPAMELFDRITGRPPLDESGAGEAVDHFVFIGAAAAMSAMPAISRGM